MPSAPRLRQPFRLPPTTASETRLSEIDPNAARDELDASIATAAAVMLAPVVPVRTPCALIDPLLTSPPNELTQSQMRIPVAYTKPLPAMVASAEIVPLFAMPPRNLPFCRTMPATDAHVVPDPKAAIVPLLLIAPEEAPREFTVMPVASRPAPCWVHFNPALCRVANGRSAPARSF